MMLKFDLLKNNTFNQVNNLPRYLNYGGVGGGVGWVVYLSEKISTYEQFSFLRKLMWALVKNLLWHFCSYFFSPRSNLKPCK